MKKLLTLFTITIVTLNTFGQSNIFPPEGNVRIGTKYDGSILNILKKPVDGEAHLLLGDSVAQSGVVSSRLCFAGNKIQQAGLAWVPNSDNSKRDGKLHLAFGNYQNPMKNSIKVTFRSNGNLGIGVISPSSKLSIYGSNSEGWNSGIELNREGGGRGLIVVDSDGMKFKTPVDGDGFYFRDNENKTSLVIKDGGQVGIGTTVIGSSYKLAVQGKIGAHEIVVTTEGWADFVFNNNYKLKDLKEVENFIEENNHLPDIPSEKEVLENGIQVGEMNAKLLQKIEELTLYTIAQQKEIEELREQNSKIEELEKQNKEILKLIKKLQ